MIFDVVVVDLKVGFRIGVVSASPVDDSVPVTDARFELRSRFAVLAGADDGG